MASFLIPQILCLFVLFPIQIAGVFHDRNVLALSNNCTADSIPCGPVPSCCAPGSSCNFRRGIPVCVGPQDQAISGFDADPCADPYLFRCDVVLGISGFCCPIGSSCRALQTDNVVHCINALGTTTLALPSATTGLVPSATPVKGNDPSIFYSPSDAWKTSSTDLSCSVSKLLHTTDTINASVSFNFTGPSIMVHTTTSSTGGVFSVWLDGFNTTSSIDTFAHPGNISLPMCYPRQFPPFAVTPPGYETRANHTVTLIYIGQSANLRAEGASTSTVQFDSFAIPDLRSHLTATNNGPPAHFNHLQVQFLFLLLIFVLPLHATLQ